MKKTLLNPDISGSPAGRTNGDGFSSLGPVSRTGSTGFPSGQLDGDLFPECGLLEGEFNLPQDMFSLLTPPVLGSTAKKLTQDIREDISEIRGPPRPNPPSNPSKNPEPPESYACLFWGSPMTS